MGISVKRKIKGVFQNIPFILAGAVKKSWVYGKGCCLVLGFLLRLEWEKGTRKETLEHPGVCRIMVSPGDSNPIRGMFCDARATWEDAVGSQW